MAIFVWRVDRFLLVSDSVIVSECGQRRRGRFKRVGGADNPCDGGGAGQKDYRRRECEPQTKHDRNPSAQDRVRM